MYESKNIDKNIIGRATKNALAKNDKKAPSRKTLIKRRGIHPIGAVFLIMNYSERRAVNINVFLVKWLSIFI